MKVLLPTSNNGKSVTSTVYTTSNITSCLTPSLFPNIRRDTSPYFFLFIFEVYCHFKFRMKNKINIVMMFQLRCSLNSDYYS